MTASDRPAGPVGSAVFSRPHEHHHDGVSTSKTSTAVVGGLGVLFAGLAHLGALGDDLARNSRLLLRNLGLYHEAILTVDDGARALQELRGGDGGERLVAFATCQLISAGAKDDLSVAGWKARLRARLPDEIADEPTSTVDGALDKGATVLTLWQANPQAAIMYARKCGVI